MTQDNNIVSGYGTILRIFSFLSHAMCFCLRQTWVIYYNLYISVSIIIIMLCILLRCTLYHIIGNNIDHTSSSVRFCECFHAVRSIGRRENNNRTRKAQRGNGKTTTVPTLPSSLTRHTYIVTVAAAMV